MKASWKENDGNDGRKRKKLVSSPRLPIGPAARSRSGTEKLRSRFLCGVLESRRTSARVMGDN
eukprot:scaffold1311_cov99-Cylindrotheca_fusiformis.AAC.2